MLLQLLAGLAPFALRGQSLGLVKISHSLVAQLLSIGGAGRRAGRGRGAGLGSDLSRALFRFFRLLCARGLRQVSKNTGHSVIESWSGTETILRRQNYQPQLRHRTAFSLDVNRFDEKQRASDWYYQQVASKNV